MKKTLLLTILICSFLTNSIASESKNTNNTKINKAFQATEDTRPKYRIGFEAPQINHRQLLLTIDENATDGVDIDFDGELTLMQADDMYWLINGGRYIVQGTNTLQSYKEFPLGIITTKGGEITINIDVIENPVIGLKVYLKDNNLGSLHNLEESNYVTTLNAGEHNNRFSLLFLSETTVDDETDGEDPTEIVEDDTEDPTEIVEDEADETNDDTVTEEDNVTPPSPPGLIPGDEETEDDNVTPPSPPGLIPGDEATEEDNVTPPSPPGLIPGDEETEDDNITPPSPPGLIPGEDDTEDTTEIVDEDADDADDENAYGRGRDHNRHHQHNKHFNREKLMIYLANGKPELTIKNSDFLRISNVAVFNKYGQQVVNCSKNLNANELNIPLRVKKGLYFVVVQTQNGPIFKQVMVQQ
jgi:hypothetical protein